MNQVNALDLIAQERAEQLAKHGYDAAHDDALIGGELEAAALAVLSEDMDRWPEGMDSQVFLKATEKNTLGRLTVAAALIAAEIDRIVRAQQRIAATNEPTP